MVWEESVDSEGGWEEGGGVGCLVGGNINFYPSHYVF